MLAAGGQQKLLLAFGLDAFGDDLDAELVREPDGGAHDRRAARIGIDAEHQFLRDLHAADRIIRQIAERRIAGAEIVDRDP